MPSSETLEALERREYERALALVEELNARVPNGVGVSPHDVTWTSLSRLLARQLYLVTAQHEILGSYMWDYQLWTHRQPARIYEDFQREPLDIYQRLVNANNNLIAALQAAMNSNPRAVWRLYPRDLEVNINA
jgi:hypothetical protein